jgi:transposase
MANEYRLSDERWALIAPLIPTGRRGVKPSRNREVISGILHVLKYGCRWRDCPEVFGPHTTIYNRLNRWSRAGIWQTVLQTLVTLDAASLQCIDSTTSKAHRCSAGGIGGAEIQAIGRSRGGRTTKIHATVDRTGRVIAFNLSPGQRGDVRAAPGLLAPLPKATHLLADTAYDSDALRQFLADRGTTPVIKPNPTRTHVPPFDTTLYKQRNLIERAFSHLKDWRRVATRYDKLARNFLATVALAAIIIWWT